MRRDVLRFDAPAWTGGAYSALRAVFGAYLAVHFAALVPYGAELFSRDGMLPAAALSPLSRAFPNVLVLVDVPWFVTTLLLVAVVASFALAIGARDRVAALVLAYVSACLFGRNPLIANPSIPFVGFMLLVHASLPRAPFGSVDALGRDDPRGDFRVPRALFAVLWIVMAVGYTYSGLTKLVSPSWIDGSAIARVLDNPLARPSWVRDIVASLPAEVLRALTWGALGAEILFAPLAVFARFRPLLWGAMLVMHLGLITLIDFADLSFGMVMLHAMTFDPAWIAPAAPRIARVYYDGSCGLCHRSVRFLLAEDAGARLRYAPLFGETFEAEVPASLRRELPDSIVVWTTDGRLRIKSDAVLTLLAELGGLWRALAVLGHFVPQAARDGAYDTIARFRRRVFAAPKDVCPVMPKELRARFSL